jgi:sugar lactone lactonase YvrE
MSGAELVLDAQSLLGECPLWDDREQCLYWVDVEERVIHAYWPATGTRQMRRLEARVSSLGLRRSGGLIVAHDRRFSVLDEGQLLHLTDDVSPPATLMNDGACDPNGRFWAGTVAPDGRPNSGILYRVEANGEVVSVVTGIGMSNGIDWSLDGLTMYHVDTRAGAVDAFSFDPELGTLSDRRRLIEIDSRDGVPDGLTVDAEGALWVAIWGGSHLRRYSPSGTMLSTATVPVSHVTSCIFGGPDLNVLYVTSARIGLHQAALARQRSAGGVFALNVGVRGRPSFRFDG